jgi:hypothetical protein
MQVIASYMADGDHAGLIACCRRLGTASRGGDPNLWTDVLTYFGEKGGPDCEKEVGGTYSARLEAFSAAMFSLGSCR